ncbi:MAG TPA: carboxypeptidase-like regulatory domain-containing protein [Longimicrobium sp.]
MRKQLRLSLAAAALLAPAAASAQVVDGLLLDGRSAEPVSRATVALLDSAGRVAASMETRADGRFRLRAAGAGLYRVRAERQGVRLAEGTVLLRERGTVQIDLRTEAGPLTAAARGDSAIALEPLEATAAVQRRYLTNAGFYDRQRVGTGVFLTGEQFAARSGARTIDALQGLRGIFYRPAGANSYVLLQRRMGGRCRVSIWVDGLPRTEEVLNDIRAEDVEAVEVYDGREIPMRFVPLMEPLDVHARRLAPRRARDGDLCGAVVFWLKRPQG